MDAPFLTATAERTEPRLSVAERLLGALAVGDLEDEWTTSEDVYYVAISRARQEARLYTDDLARLPAAVAREHAKHAALDLEGR